MYGDSSYDGAYDQETTAETTGIEAPTLKPLDVNMDIIQKDIDNVAKYYNLFFASGLASLIVLIGLFAYISHKKYQRSNPLGIMTNQMFVRIALSFRLFFVGLLFQIW